MKQSYLLLKLTLLLLFFVAITQNLQAQVSGKVFRDFNANGIQTTAAPDPIELGLKDVTINAYDATGTLNSATTIADGTYSISGGTAPYRVEFVLPSGYYASKGNVSNTTVQFVAGAANLGVNHPADFCQANPLLITPFHSSRDFGTDNDNVLAKVERLQTADPDGNSAGTTTQGSTGFGKVIYTPNRPGPGEVAKVGNLGATWGLAYNKLTKKLYAASYIKRGTRLGPGESTGAIWVIDDIANSSTPTVYVDLNTVFGANTTGTNPHPNATTTWTSNGWDLNTLSKVGKVGLGDLEMSKDGSRMYVVNLFDRKLYEIPTSGVLDATTIQRYDIPTMGLPVVTDAAGSVGSANAIDIRPFGLGFDKDGVLFVGAVHSAESISSGANTEPNNASYQMTAYVWKFVAGTFTLVLNESLRFDRDNSNSYTVEDLPTSDNTKDTDWEPWSNIDDNGNAQAMLTDIDFLDGNMVLGFRDRAGDQAYGPISGGGYKASGDIYLACPQGATWKFEQNGVCGTLSSSRAGNKEGPGGGEFFNDFQGDNTKNAGNGGLFILPGYGVMSTATDAVIRKSDGTKLNNVAAAGVQTYNPVNGDYIGGYDVFYGNPKERFGKASGLGDLEVLCDPQPIEIGNRVFMDTNKNGEQDPTEMGLDGVAVELWKAGTKVMDIVTSNGGQWFFSNLDANTDYEVKILAANLPLGKELTTTNTAANAKDLIDNDATLVGADAVISYKTGSAGQNNHSLDFGFKVACTKPSAITFTKAAPTCTGATSNNDGKITFTSVIGADKYSIGTGATSTGTYATATAIPASGLDLQTAIPNAGATYTIRFYNGAEDCFKDTTTVFDVVTCTAAPLGSISGKFWKDTNNDGLENNSELVFGSVKVELFASDASGMPMGAALQTVTTTSTGLYSFANLPQGDYVVKIDKTTIMTGMELGTKKDVGADDTIDNDFDAALGLSGKIVLNPANPATKDFPNVNAAIINTPVACSLAVIAVVPTQPTCANNDGAINLTVTGATGTPTYKWSNGATTQNLTGLPAGDYTVTVTDGACTATAMASLDKKNMNILYAICPGDSYKLEIQDATLTGIQWLKNGVAISGANGLAYTATQVGIYTYTSNGLGGCAVGQCCPIEITASTNCCKPVICTSVKITKK